MLTFTYRHSSLVQGYGIGISEEVDDSSRYLVKISFVFDDSLSNSFHLLSNQECSCRVQNRTRTGHECCISLHQPQPLMSVRVRKDR